MSDIHGFPVCFISFSHSNQELLNLIAHFIETKHDHLKLNSAGFIFIAKNLSTPIWTINNPVIYYQMKTCLSLKLGLCLLSDCQQNDRKM